MVNSYTLVVNVDDAEVNMHVVSENVVVVNLASVTLVVLLI